MTARRATALVVVAVFLGHSGQAFGARAEITYPRHKPRGVALLFHEGAWKSGNGDRWLAKERPDARWVARHGWIAVNYSYAAGRASLADTRREFRRVRRRWPKLPVCAIGQSSGGHLALMLAARYRTLSCAITVGAPTDLRTWAGGRWLPLMGDASPARLPVRAKHVLLLQVWKDKIVPRSQARTYIRAHHRARIKWLDWSAIHPFGTAWARPGEPPDGWLMHGVLSRPDWRSYRAAEARALRVAWRRPR